MISLRSQLQKAKYAEDMQANSFAMRSFEDLQKNLEAKVFTFARVLV